MGYFGDKEKLRIALEVIESDRRTKRQYDLMTKILRSERFIATLIAALVGLFIVFVVLPTPKPKPDQPEEISPLVKQAINFKTK